MAQNKNAEYYAQLVDLSDGHTLRLADSTTHKNKGVVCDTQWFEERDANEQLVARYRSWSSRAINPPYRKQLGWERFSLSGELLDREVRYSKRQDMQYLH